MNLAPGSRLEAGGSAYLLGDPLPGEFRSPWRRARKVLRNYRHADRSLHEASGEEFLDVLIHGPGSSIATIDRELRTAYSIAEAGWFPEPIDVIETDAGPFLVVADPHAAPLLECPAAARGEILGEIMRMFRTLADHGLAPDSFEPSEFLVDRDGRPYYLGADRLSRIEPDPARWDEFVEKVAPGGWKPSGSSHRPVDPRITGRSSLRALFRKLRRRG